MGLVSGCRAFYRSWKNTILKPHFSCLRIPLDGIRIWSDANPPFSVTIKSLPVGTHTLSATFTPTDTANYTAATKTVTIVVTTPVPTLRSPRVLMLAVK